MTDWINQLIFMSRLWFWITNYLNTTLKIEGQHSIVFCKTQEKKKWCKYHTNIWNFKINLFGCNTGILHEPTFLNSILSSWGIPRPAIVTCLSTSSQSVFLPLVLAITHGWIQVSSNSVSATLLLARPQILLMKLPVSVHFPRLLAYHPPYALDWSWTI